MWGSNAREAHPIFFHHVLKGIRNGAKMYAVDPRRRHPRSGPTPGSASTSAATSRSPTRSPRDHHRRPGQRGRSSGAPRSDFEQYRESVAQYTLERAERDYRRARGAHPKLAHDYAKADRAQICWTLGITEHHNAADNVLALINLAPAHRPRRPLRLRAGPAPRPEQRPGRRRHGRHPQQAARLPGHRARPRGAPPVRASTGASRSRRRRAGTSSQMFDAMDRGELTALYIIGENPALRGRHAAHPQDARGPGLPGRPGHRHDRTAELADVVLPATASWCESEGTVTNSERRVQRVRKAIEPPGDARDDIWIICRARPAPRPRLGQPDPEDVWEELRTLSPDARRHELRAARSARRRPVALPRRGVGPGSSSCTPASGRKTRPARRRGAVPRWPSTRDPSTRSTTSIRSG